MKQMRVTSRAKLVVGYWELVPMESGADNSSEQDTATVTKEVEEPTENQKKNFWWKEENWPRLKKVLERRRNPVVNGVCDAACLGLGRDPVTQMTVANFFQRIVSKPIIYENDPPHPKVLHVSCNNYIFNILYLPLHYG